MKSATTTQPLEKQKQDSGATGEYIFSTKPASARIYGDYMFFTEFVHPEASPTTKVFEVQDIFRYSQHFLPLTKDRASPFQLPSRKPPHRCCKIAPWCTAWPCAPGRALRSLRPASLLYTTTQKSEAGHPKYQRRTLSAPRFSRKRRTHLQRSCGLIAVDAVCRLASVCRVQPRQGSPSHKATGFAKQTTKTLIDPLYTPLKSNGKPKQAQHHREINSLRLLAR